MIRYILITLIINIIYPQLTAKFIAGDFNEPLYLKNYPGKPDTLLILEQEGIIQLIYNNKKSQIPFLDITDRVHEPWYPADEMGFLGLAFDPNFKNNGRFYVNYVNDNSETIISRFNTKGEIGDKNSEEILISLKQPYPNHNGGFLEFGPDGYLYISIGDGGSTGDPDNRAQNLSNLFGTILRIDVNTKEKYLIPKDNPFINNSNVKKEIWHYGFRNVWRFSFDKLNGDMYIGDVGQNNWEEINFIMANSKGGSNFGWSILEGNHCYPEDNNKCNSQNTVMPLFEYPNDANYLKTIVGITQSKMHGCSVTGGYVYRGSKKPELYGRYFFGDYCTGKVWSLKNNNGNIDIIDHTIELLEGMNKKQFYLSSFGEDENGELYIIDYTGDVYSVTK
jgi:glucose/arabinose dehydrogenase